MSLTNQTLSFLRLQLRSAACYGESCARLPLRATLRDERTIRRWLQSQGLNVKVGMDAVKGKFCRALIFQVPKKN